MREHKYKAKRLDGQWVEGYYFAKPILNLHFIILGENQWMIEPETLCEFTGEYDKEGNMIWEHDIVINDGKTGIIIYKKNYHAFVCLHLKNTDLFSFISNLGTRAKQISSDAGCKIIGNIFDNPELLEVK